MTVVGKNIECDTQKLYDDAKDIIDLVATYETEIEKFFDRIDFTPRETTAWVGDNAITYSNLIIQDNFVIKSLNPFIIKLGKQCLLTQLFKDIL